MAAKKSNAGGLAFLVKALEGNKAIPYAEAAAAAAKKGFKVWPIMFGKAKLMLGHVKAGKGKTKAKAAKAAGRGPGRPPNAIGKRGPGRPRQVAGAGIQGLESIVALVRGSRQELARYQAALAKVRAIVTSL